MYGGARHFAAAAVIGFCIIPATAARAEDEHRDDEANRYVITNLVSDLPGAAAVQDNVLQNSWGVAFFPGGPHGVRDALRRRRRDRAFASQYSIAGQHGAPYRL
jgi:hypothetical protein